MIDTKIDQNNVRYKIMQNLPQDSNQDKFAEKLKIDQPEKALNCLK